MIRLDQESQKRIPEDLQRKRTRNRLSQRTYRRRHAEYVRDLQKCVERANAPESEALKQMRSENQCLRKQLVELQSKLTGLTETLKVLAGSVSNVLDKCSAEGSSNEAAEIVPSSEPSGSEPQDQIFNPGPGVSAAYSVAAVGDPFLPLLQPSTTISSPSWSSQVNGCLETSRDGFCWDSISDNSSSLLLPQIPNIWSHEYQMGLQPYTRALFECEHSSLTLGKAWVETNSPFSDHISTLRHLLMTKIGHIGPQLKQYEMLYRQVLAALGLFNSLTRPAAMAWYAKTRFYHIVDLTTWQLHPCPELLNKVEKQYRPTMLQLQHKHPGIIDWIPFPALRNRLILLHSANPQIDQIFCDVVSSYVVEACMADLVLGAPATRVYVRVTDVAMGLADGEIKDIDLLAVLPASDISSLFSVGDGAQAVFKLLNMNHGVSHYKLDPSFFCTYPELFDPEDDIVAHGLPLRPSQQTILPSPSRLNDLTFQTYRSFLEFHTLAPL